MQNRMDPAVIMESVMREYMRQGIVLKHENTLSLRDCATRFTVCHSLSTYENETLQPTGGILYYQHVPLLFLHCVQSNDDCLNVAECAVFLRATEMFFAGHSVYPVMFLVEDGSPEFWCCMRILQMGHNKQNPYKLAGHSIPIVIPYTSDEAAVDIGVSIVRDALDAATVPVADR